MAWRWWLAATIFSPGAAVLGPYRPGEGQGGPRRVVLPGAAAGNRCMRPARLPERVTGEQRFSVTPNSIFNTERIKPGQGKATPNRSLERGIAVLRAFRAGSSMLGNSEIAERTGLSRSTVSRLTQSLIETGML